MKYLFLATAFSAAVSLSSPEDYPIKNFPFRGMLNPSEYTAQRAEPYKVALYDDLGVWDTGREHLKMYLKEHSISYTTIDARGILDRKLKALNIDTLIMPGGRSIDYLASLGDAGAEIIRQFVGDGGGYIGICAGSFYAISHRIGGAATGKYGIGLLDGTAYDGTALQTAPFIEGMMDFPMLVGGLLFGFPAKYRIVLFGGPSFQYSVEEAAKKKTEVLARVDQVLEPTMLTLTYGRGPVFLSGPHLEIEEDRTDWGLEFKDPDSEWPILNRVFEYMRDAKKKR